MITEAHGQWHYVAIKNISGLLGGIASTHNGDFCCSNCFHSYRTQNKLKEHEQLCEKHNFCNLKLTDEEHKYISSTSGKNTLKNPFIIYADLECLLLIWTHAKILITAHLQSANHYIYHQLFLYLPAILLINR